MNNWFSSYNTTVCICDSQAGVPAQSSHDDNPVLHRHRVRALVAPHDRLHRGDGAQPPRHHLAPDHLSRVLRVPPGRHELHRHQPPALRMAKHELPPRTWLRPRQVRCFLVNYCKTQLETRINRKYKYNII